MFEAVICDMEQVGVLAFSPRLAESWLGRRTV